MGLAKVGDTLVAEAKLRFVIVAPSHATGTLDRIDSDCSVPSNVA
jgi:hypothetical protein